MVLGGIRATLGPLEGSWDLLGRYGRHLGATMGPLEAILGPLGAMLGPPGAVLRPLGAVLWVMLPQVDFQKKSGPIL